MSLAPGIRLGPYEITAKLGEGGMGEVYRATDTKLRRDVAIKVLPSAFTEDKERLARFEREAQLLAQLHHPNIASIFGLEESSGVRALVMELVEGPTLAERLENGPLPLDESLSVARQIAEALEEAHEKGIVHRDLKPQNIKASREGKVKVLDFGLAKALDPMSSSSASASQLAQSPTLTFGATQMGVILGTAAYMSPEQAKGLAVDKRADIWAFGVVLFEMLTGRRLFAGDSVTETLAAVLTREIDWKALPATTPPALRRLLERCLDRDVKQRLRDIGEARVTLEESRSQSRGERALPRERASRSPVTSRGRWLATAFLLLVAGSAIVLWQRARTAPDVPGQGERASRSIAVLPFVNSSGSAEDEYLADGMTDELIAGLGKVPGLHVAARSSAFSFKGQQTEAREVARKLGVDTVLEGTVRRSGRRLRVTASLVSAADGMQLWSSTFENEGGDAFAVQDEVTRGVVAGLSLQLRGAALVASQAGRTKDPEALDLYLRGLASANAASEAELRRALDFYQQAIARDPEFALAYAGIAWVHTFLADAYVVPLEAYPKVKAAAQAALDHDGRVADAHSLLANSTYALTWKYGPEVDRGFRRALELDPNSVNSRFLVAANRCFGDHPDEAFGDIDRAELLDPLSPLPPMLRELCYYRMRRYSDVIEAHRKTAAIDPSFVYLESWVAAAYRELGDYPAALREYGAAAESLGGAPQYGLALTYARMGRDEDARAILNEMEERARTRYVPYFMRAMVHAALGELDEAVVLLEQAVVKREGLVLLIRSLPEVAPLAQDPRGKRILEQVDAMRKAG